MSFELLPYSSDRVGVFLKSTIEWHALRVQDDQAIE
jgi:hypothetical protein